MGGRATPHVTEACDGANFRAWNDRSRADLGIDCLGCPGTRRCSGRAGQRSGWVIVGSDSAKNHVKDPTMTHHQSALSSLLQELLDDPSLAYEELFRRLLQAGLQDLIDAETTVKIGADLALGNTPMMRCWCSGSASAASMRSFEAGPCRDGSQWTMVGLIVTWRRLRHGRGAMGPRMVAA